MCWRPAGHTVESYAETCADALQSRLRELGPDTVLAFVVEPVGGLASGCVVPPDGYFRRIRDICNRYGIYYSRRTAGGKYGDWFIVAPPLTITEAECDELVSRLSATLKNFTDEWTLNFKQFGPPMDNL